MINDYTKFFKNDLVLIETPRLRLRRMSVSDRDDMFEYARREDVTRYLLWKPHKTSDHTKRYLTYVTGLYKSGDFYDFAVEYRENSKMIGTCGFASLDSVNDCGEVGYVLSHDYWGKGIATEALSAMIRFGFCDLELNRIEARYMSDNIASRRVMEKCAMTYEGTFRQKLLVKGQYRDIGVCSLLSSDYFSQNSHESALSPKKARFLGFF